MIVFKTVTWKNFLSTGNTPIEIALDNSPSTLIIGDNGSGKSTVLDALTFVLFGKPFRRIKKDQLVNSVNGRDCIVEVYFDIGKRKYLVITRYQDQLGLKSIWMVNYSIKMLPLKTIRNNWRIIYSSSIIGRLHKWLYWGHHLLFHSCS